jgi:hypothetical protein
MSCARPLDRRARETRNRGATPREEPSRLNPASLPAAPEPFRGEGGIAAWLIHAATDTPGFAPSFCTTILHIHPAISGISSQGILIDVSVREAEMLGCEADGEP